jgi:hypothetical protein
MQARMRQTYLFSVVVAVALVVVLGGTALAQSRDPSVGTWKLNVAKSKYEPGPAPMSEMRIYEQWETDGIKGTFNLVQKDGTRVPLGFAAHYDGKDYKFMGSLDFDTVALKRVDANTTDATLKKSGKVVQRTKVVVSNNGKVRTLTTTGTDAKGQKVNSVQVYDKQ